MSPGRRDPSAVALAILAGALAGAAGLGTQVVLSGWSGLVAGQGQGAAIALGAWIVGWSVGAWLARDVVRVGRCLGLAGLAAALLAWSSRASLGALALAPPGAWSSVILVVIVVGAAALPQGLFLPLILRARPGLDVGWLVAANLGGAVAGAHWIGHDAAGRMGRDGALVLAALTAIAAGVLGRLGSPALAAPEEAPEGTSEDMSPGSALGSASAALFVGLGTAWALGVEWVALRLGALWFGGLQAALSGVLAASLVALAVGAALVPRLVPRDGRGMLGVVALAVAGSAWVVLGPGVVGLAAPGDQPFLGTLIYMGPALAPLGALVPVLHRARPGEPGRRLSDLFVHEAWGAPLGIGLAHVLLVPELGCGGTLATFSILGGLGCLLVPGALRSPVAWGASGLGVGLGVFMFLEPEPALASPALDRPDFEILAFTEDAEFAVSVVRDSLRGERTLLTDEFRATAIGDEYLYMRVLGHLPVLFHPDPRRVGVLALGTGTTVGSVSLHPDVERIDVLEISRAVVEFAPYFEEVHLGALDEGLPGLLELEEGERVGLYLGDGRRTLARLPEGSLDVLTMEPLLPDSPAAVFLYTPEFYSLARRALADNGLVCQWVPPHALAPDTFDAVVSAFTGAFPWSGVFQFGTQVILLGGDSRPAPMSSRFPSEGELHEALLELGLEDLGGIVHRLVFEGAAAELAPSARPLKDSDPWVLYVPRPRGVEPLGWLPRNLAWLRGREGRVPESWRTAAGVLEADRGRRLGQVRRLTEAWHAHRAASVGLVIERDTGAPLLAELLPELGPLAGREVEAAVLAREIQFEDARGRGLSALEAEDGRTALDYLTRAAQMRPLRADIHLFVSLAALRVGEAPVARAAAARAAELCPRILETRPGEQALRMGLPRNLLEGTRR